MLRHVPRAPGPRHPHPRRGLSGSLLPEEGKGGSEWKCTRGPKSPLQSAEGHLRTQTCPAPEAPTYRGGGRTESKFHSSPIPLIHQASRSLQSTAPTQERWFTGQTTMTSKRRGVNPNHCAGPEDDELMPPSGDAGFLSIHTITEHR